MILNMNYDQMCFQELVEPDLPLALQGFPFCGGGPFYVHATGAFSLGPRWFLRRLEDKIKQISIVSLH